MATEIKVGQTIPFSIAFLDQDGKPMATAPAPDAAPQWSNSAPSVETLTAAPDGLSAAALGIAAGSDTVKLDLMVGGVAFSATLDMTVASVQRLTSIQIVPGTPSP